jgi:uncharacterized protein (TIGR02118 family)
MKSLTILYPNGDDVRFDFDYYKDHHLPLVMKLFGPLIKRFELRKGLKSPTADKLPYIAVVNIWFEDEAAFMAADEKHRPTLLPDVKNYTNVMPIIQEDDLFAVATT